MNNNSKVKYTAQVLYNILRIIGIPFIICDYIEQCCLLMYINLDFFSQCSAMYIYYHSILY